MCRLGSCLGSMQATTFCETLQNTPSNIYGQLGPEDIILLEYSIIVREHEVRKVLQMVIKQ